MILIADAGISASLGIPDFRSKGTGLYSILDHLGLNDSTQRMKATMLLHSIIPSCTFESQTNTFRLSST